MRLLVVAVLSSLDADGRPVFASRCLYQPIQVSDAPMVGDRPVLDAHRIDGDETHAPAGCVSREMGLGLTRIGGHPERFRERCHHAENPSSVFT